MLVAAPAVRRAAPPLARALVTTATGRGGAAEREWARRIERRRADLVARRWSLDPEQTGVWDAGAAVRWMSAPPVLGRLLLRIARELRPLNALEIGTGFGISGLYLAAGLELNGGGVLTTIDADPRPASFAADGFAELGVGGRVTVEAGEPAATLGRVLERSPRFDLAFVDGDHNGPATAAAFAAIEPRLAPGAVVVLDDVSRAWEGMTTVWRQISRGPGVAARSALGRFAILVLR